ncbi:MAG TPA: hypothetical protein VFB25_03810 [Gaiellaceae bacterium]|nr:hypothetical protein [Gaiellaceae bacterium]
MAPSRLLLAAGTAAAALVASGPAITHAGASPAAPLRVGDDGVSVSVASLRGGASATASIVVPRGDSKLVGTHSGSPAVDDRTQLRIVRVSDGATLFTGSLGTFGELPVVAGTALRVVVSKPVGFSRLQAAAVLRWS